MAYGQTGGCLFPGIFHGCPKNVIFDRANAHGFPSLRRAIPQIAASRPRSGRQYRVRRWCKQLDLAPHPRGSGLVFQFLLVPVLYPSRRFNAINQGGLLANRIIKGRISPKESRKIIRNQMVCGRRSLVRISLGGGPAKVMRRPFENQRRMFL